jgi:hypothetical protein
MPEEKKLPMISVRGAGNDRKVALWERHPQHPEGEAFVVNEDVSREVAETPTVKRLIAEGVLVKANQTSTTSFISGEQEKETELPERNLGGRPRKTE